MSGKFRCLFILVLYLIHSVQHGKVCVIIKHLHWNGGAIDTVSALDDVILCDLHCGTGREEDGVRMILPVPNLDPGPHIDRLVTLGRDDGVPSPGHYTVVTGGDVNTGSLTSPVVQSKIIFDYQTFNPI